VSRQVAPPEIHEQEGEVVQHVDAGEIVVELDRVEESRSSVDQDDVTQVEIAVTLADESRCAAIVE
jgi:hypothetical protein